MANTVIQVPIISHLDKCNGFLFDFLLRDLYKPNVTAWFEILQWLFILLKLKQKSLLWSIRTCTIWSPPLWTHWASVLTSCVPATMTFLQFLAECVPSTKSLCLLLLSEVLWEALSVPSQELGLKSDSSSLPLLCLSAKSVCLLTSVRYLLPGPWSGAGF